MTVGLVTNFKLQTESDVWTPQDTRSVQHGNWIEDESGFPEDPRHMMLIVHRNGKNILGDDKEQLELAKEGVGLVFEAIDVVRNTPNYHSVCSKRDYVNPVTNETTCDIISIARFWNDDASLFEEQVNSNQDAIEAMSSKTYPSERRVDIDQIIGYNECDYDAVNCSEAGSLTSGLSYITVIGFPGDDEVEDETEDFEKDAIDNLKELQKSLG